MNSFELKQINDFASAFVAEFSSISGFTLVHNGGGVEIADSGFGNRILKTGFFVAKSGSKSYAVGTGSILREKSEAHHMTAPVYILAETGFARVAEKRIFSAMKAGTSPEALAKQLAVDVLSGESLTPYESAVSYGFTNSIGFPKKDIGKIDKDALWTSGNLIEDYENYKDIKGSSIGKYNNNWSYIIKREL